MRTTASARRNMVTAIARGRVPSLADHIAAGTLGDLVRQSQAAVEEVEPEPEVETTPVTTRPQPAPEPPAPAPPPVVPDPTLVPEDPVLDPAVEQVLATRVTLMNPHLSKQQVKAVVRRAAAYLR